MEFFSRDQKVSKLAYYLFTALLVLTIISLLVVILFFPYKKITMSYNAVIDVEVSLQNKSFNGIIKTPESSYFAISHPKGTLSMTAENIWVYLIAQSKYIFLLIAGLIVIINARILLRKIKEEKAFDNDNSKIVYLIATIVIIMPFLLALRTYMLNQYIPDNLIINGYKVIKPDPYNNEPFIRAFIWGILLMALGNVFKQGRRIKEENDLTV